MQRRIFNSLLFSFCTSFLVVSTVKTSSYEIPCSNPMVKVYISQLRDKNTTLSEFRQASDQLATLLAAEVASLVTVSKKEKLKQYLTLPQIILNQIKILFLYRSSDLAM